MLLGRKALTVPLKVGHIKSFFNFADFSFRIGAFLTFNERTDYTGCIQTECYLPGYDLSGSDIGTHIKLK